MRKWLLMSCVLMQTLAVNAQHVNDLPNGDPYPGYNRAPSVDPALGWTYTKQRRAAGTAAYPDHWNTGNQRYFPPIINQGGYGSCGVSSHVGHMLTSEMNAYYNTDASLLSNQLTPMFEYPFTYNGPGKDEMALYVGYPTADIYGGRYESSIYGGSEWKNSTWGWCTGYDLFYNAMKNRISRAAGFPAAVDTPEGAAAVKAYLYNHAGDPDFGGRGGTVCIGVGIANSARARIPSTTQNDNIGVSNQEYLLHWNIGGYDHAMCMVGYDDRIQFDLDANGIPGETSNQFGQNENGAWIIANSWGPGWGNGGFIYCPYALSAGICARVTNSAGRECYKTPDGQGAWQPYVYYFRKGYTPLRTMKVRMQYSKRSEISVRVGVATDTTATRPERVYQFQYINYTGDGDGNGVDAETPLLGRWADGTMHTEPMEFGVDLTDLTAQVNRRQPLKYFLIINSKSTANGQGKVLDASVLDYEFDEQGVETPFAAKNVEIQTAGRQTIMSVVVNSEAFNPPLNLVMTAGKLSWEAPAGTAYTPSKYYVYNGTTQIGETTNLEYTPTDADGTFSVKAVYVYGGKEYLSEAGNTVRSGAVLSAEEAYDNKVLTVTNGAFYIPEVVRTSHKNYTVEMWFKPSNLRNWGDFLFYGDPWGAKYRVHTDANGAVTAGWALGSERISTPNGMLRNGVWAHIAIVVEGSKHSIYIDGVQRATGTASSHSDFPAYWEGRLYFGNANSLNGQIDEMRLWDCARTADEIRNNMRLAVGNPSAMEHLEAYLKMDTYEAGGTTYIKDWAHGRDAVVIQGITSGTVAAGQTISRNASVGAAPGISVPTEVVRGQAVRAVGSGNVAVTQYSWTATHARPSESSIQSPSFVFDALGPQTLTLTATDLNGNVGTTQQTVNVVEVGATAAFTLSADTVLGSDRVSMNALNRAPGCRYEWYMPGADTEHATTMKASASYSSPGEKTITLTVIDPAGNRLVESHTVLVRNSVPVIKYSIQPAVVVKGEPVQLTDNSNYNPTLWKWSFRSNNYAMSFAQADGTLVPDKAGVYDMTLTVGNEMGMSVQTAKRALIVCNAASETGLSFYSNSVNQTLTTALPAALGTNWTLDFWMNPENFTALCDGIYLSAADKTLKIEADASGNAVVSAGATQTTVQNFYTAKEWHHYAFVRSGNTLTLYRDGTQAGTYTSAELPDVANIVFGSDAARMYGMLDEVRLWNVARTQAELRSGAMQPISDVAQAKSRGLKVYYTFNQSLGNAQDACGTAEGVTSGFDNLVGWYADSKGVFCLNFDTPKNETLVGVLLPHAHYEAVGESSADGTGHGAAAAYDEKMDSWWISSSAERLPQWVMFRSTYLDKVQSIQLKYNANYDFRAANVTVEQSDDKVNWEPLDVGHELFNFQQQNIVLAKPATKTYIRLTVHSTIWNETKANINELLFYGVSSTEMRYYPDLFEKYYTKENKRWGDWYWDKTLEGVIDMYRRNPSATTYAQVMNAPKSYVAPQYPVTLYNVAAARNMAVTMPDVLYALPANGTDLMQLWKVTAPAYRKVVLQHMATGLYAQQAEYGQNSQTKVGVSPYQYTVDVINDNTVAFHNGDAGNNYLRYEPENGGVYFNSWNNNKEMRYNEVRTLTLPLTAIGEKTYSTCYMPFGVHVTGATPYAVAYNEDKSHLQLTSMGQDVPANTPMLLISDEKNAQVELTVDDAISGEYATILSGTCVPMPWNTEYLSLGRNNGVPGFYKWTGRTLGAGKCYLVCDVAAYAQGITIEIDGVTTNLDMPILNADDDAPRYNLSGQRVDRNYKGVVIMKGKKYVQ